VELPSKVNVTGLGLFPRHKLLGKVEGAELGSPCMHLHAYASRREEPALPTTATLR
jgi:hypothetical protein